MQLEVGKKYSTRDGQTVTIVNKLNTEVPIFVGLLTTKEYSVYLRFYEYGSWVCPYYKSSNDLVKELKNDES